MLNACKYSPHWANIEFRILSIVESRTETIACRLHQRKRKNATANGSSSSPTKRLITNLALPSPTTDAPLSGTLPPSESNGTEGLATNTPNESPGSYLGRTAYVSGTVPIDEEDAKRYSSGRGTALPELDKKFLQDLHAFDLPARSIRESLISRFMDKCYPWMPIVEVDELQKADDTEPSILLLQSVFVAGSRVSMAPHAQASGHSFYRKAKALYWMGHEKDPLATVRAVCILQWWNPSGPEHISMDASSFWLHMGVALAHQSGLHREPNPKQSDASLRRRVWWTLFTRDCVISMCHGRPRSINLDDGDVRPLTLDDFPSPGPDAHLFIAYVDICKILGDLTEGVSRASLGRWQSVSLQSQMLSWIADLPDTLRIYHPESHSLFPYNVKARQLHVSYFTALTLLFRPTTTGNIPSGAALLASSFCAGIFEDFLARGELPILAPAYIFHLMTNAYAQLACFNYPTLWPKAEAELEVVNQCLIEMAKRYPSAIGAQRVIKAVSRSVKKQERHDGQLQLVFDKEQKRYFDLLGPELCNKWDLVYSERIDKSAQNEHSNERNLGLEQFQSADGAPVGQEFVTEGSNSITLINTSQPFVPLAMAPPQAAEYHDPIPDLEALLQHGSTFDDTQVLPFVSVGNWMLGDWMADLGWTSADYLPES